MGAVTFIVGMIAVGTGVGSILLGSTLLGVLCIVAGVVLLHAD